MKTLIALIAIVLSSLGLYHPAMPTQSVATQATSTAPIVVQKTEEKTKHVVANPKKEVVKKIESETPTTTPKVFTLTNGAKVDVQGKPQTGADYFKVKNTCIGAPDSIYGDCVSYSINLPPAVDPENYYNDNKTCAGLQYDQYNQCMAYAINLPSPLTPEQYYAQQDAKATPIPPPLPTPGRVDAKGAPLSGPDWYKIYKTCIGAPAYQSLGCWNYQKSLQP